MTKYESLEEKFSKPEEKKETNLEKAKQFYKDIEAVNKSLFYKNTTIKNYKKNITLATAKFIGIKNKEEMQRLECLVTPYLDPIIKAYEEFKDGVGTAALSEIGESMKKFVVNILGSYAKHVANEEGWKFDKRYKNEIYYNNLLKELGLKQK